MRLLLLISLLISTPLFAQQISEKMYAYAVTGLKLRSAPSIDSMVITKVKYGDSLEVFNTQSKEKAFVVDGLKGAFVKVKYGDIEGFVFSGYLSHFIAPKSLGGWVVIRDYLTQTYGKCDKKTLEKELNPYNSDDMKYGVQFTPTIKYYDFSSECYTNERLVVKGLSMQEAFLFVSTFNWNYRQLGLGGKFEYTKELGTYSKDQMPLKEQYARGISYQLDKYGNYKLIEMYFDCEAGSGSVRVMKGKNDVVIEFSYSCS